MVKSDEPRLVELDLAGMTCAACASRIERRLNKIDGVIATVNYATERAAVEIDSELTVEEIVEAVKSTGYQAQRWSFPACSWSPTRCIYAHFAPSMTSSRDVGMRW